MKLIAFAALLLIACSNENAAPGTSAPADSQRISADSAPVRPHPEALNLSGCYRRVQSRDTMNLCLTQNGTDLTGTLQFDNYEKDASSGTVKGKVQGDVLMLWYNFQSEGMNSVSQVFFKREGDLLIFGTGPVDVKGDTAYFTNRAQVKYEPDFTLSKLR